MKRKLVCLGKHLRIVIWELNRHCCSWQQAVLEHNIVRQLEHYVCLLYQPDTTLVTQNELRWWIFLCKQAEAERLPPTKAALMDRLSKEHSGIMILLLMGIYHHHQSMDMERLLGILSCNDYNGSSS